MDEIRALVRTNPTSALERLRHPGESGLTIMGEADMLDEVVGQYSDPAVARDIINRNLTHERQIELIAARGDLPSSAAFVVDRDVVFSALLRELAEDVREPDRTEDDLGGDLVGHAQTDPFVIRAWAHKYCERDDWAALLDRMIGEYTVREHLLIAIWNDVGCPQVFDDPPEATSHGEGDDEGDDEDDGVFHGRLTDDLFDVVGLGPDEAREALSTLINQGRAMQLSREAIDEAKSMIAERRRERETAPLSSNAARGASEETKSELDI